MCVCVCVCVCVCAYLFVQTYVNVGNVYFSETNYQYLTKTTITFDNIMFTLFLCVLVRSSGSETLF